MAAKKNFLFAGLNFGLKTFNNLIVFGILARIVGLASFGLLSYLIALIILISTISVFGYRMKIIKEIAVNKGLVDVNYILPKLLVVLLTYCIAIGMIGFYLGIYFDSEISYLAALLFCATSICFALSNFLSAFFHAINKYHLETYNLCVFSIILFIGLYFTWDTHHMRYFAVAYGVGGLVMAVMSCIFFWNNYKLQFANKIKKINFRSIRSEIWLAAPFAVISIGDIMFNTIDTMIVEAYLPSEDLGVYMGALKIVLGLCLVSAVAYSAAFPTVSRILSAPTRKGMHTLFKLQGGLMFIGMSACAIYLCFDDFLIDLFLGTNFSECSYHDVNDFSVWIVILAITRYCVQIPAIFLIASGQHKNRALALVSFLIISFVAYLFFIPYYGLYAAISIFSIANICLLLVYVIISAISYFRLKY